MIQCDLILNTARILSIPWSKMENCMDWVVMTPAAAWFHWSLFSYIISKERTFGITLFWLLLRKKKYQGPGVLNILYPTCLPLIVRSWENRPKCRWPLLKEA